MSKYGNKRTALNGYLFDSKAEAARYSSLLILQRGGVIHDLRVHPSFTLLEKFKHRGKTHRAVKYEADFSYVEDGVLVVEDVKGSPKTITSEARIKHKLLLFKHPEVDFRIVYAKDVA